MAEPNDPPPVPDLLVYVAGPISRGDLAANVRRACAAGVRLMRAGLAAHVPHLTCYMGQVHDGRGVIPEVLPDGTAVEDWYGVGLAEVRRCDAVLRLPGESRGADLEAAEARRHGRPVFVAVEEVVAWARSLPAKGLPAGGWTVLPQAPHYTAADPAAVATFTYTNHRGLVETRRVLPYQIRFAATEWHPQPQWLLEAFDLDRQAVRSFALKDISAWAPWAPPK